MITDFIVKSNDINVDYNIKMYLTYIYKDKNIGYDDNLII